MNAKLLFLISTAIFLLGEVQAQVHLRSSGASIRIPENIVLHCSGNLSFEEGLAKSSDLVLEGALELKGDLINAGTTETHAKSFHSTGRLVLSDQTQRQYIRGNYTFRVPRVVLNNPKGLGLKQDLEITKDLSLQQGKIYTGTKLLSIISSDSTAISNYGRDTYIVGNLRRYLAPGKNIFPIGSESHLQLLRMNIDQVNPSEYVEVEFSKIPGVLTEPVAVDGGRITELLDNGTWKISSNAEPSSVFTLSLEAQAYTNGGTQEGMHTFLVDKGTGWESIGQADRVLGSETQIRVTRSGIDAFGDFAIGKAAYVLSNPALLPVSQFRISHNGSKEKKIGLSFYANSPGAYSLDVRDIRGRKLMTWNSFAITGNNETEIDLSPFPQGIYILTLQKDGLQLEHKIW